MQAFDDAMREFESFDGATRETDGRQPMRDVYDMWYQQHLQASDAAQSKEALRSSWLRRVVRETEHWAEADGAAVPVPPALPLPDAWQGGAEVVALHRADLEAMLGAWFHAGRSAGRAEAAARTLTDHRDRVGDE